MAKHRIDASDNVRDIVPDNEKIIVITSVPGAVVVETEPWDENNSEELSFDGMSRAELYEYGKDSDADLVWSGDDADTKEEMADKLREALEGEK